MRELHTLRGVVVGVPLERDPRLALAERENARLGDRLADADERATHAVVRVAELEAEVDTLTAQWQAAEAAATQAAESARPVRKGA